MVVVVVVLVIVLPMITPEPWRKIGTWWIGPALRPANCTPADGPAGRGFVDVWLAASADIGAATIIAAHRSEIAERFICIFLTD